MFSYLRIVLAVLLATGAGPLTAQLQAQPVQETAPLARFEFLQIRMAIPVRLTVYAPDEATANLATDRAYARFKQLDLVFSDYDPDSELSTLCRNAVPGEPHPVSPELFAVLQRAAEISKLSDGAFDVTVGPITELWRKTRRRKLLPSEDVRRAALKPVGWSSVVLCEQSRTVTLEKAGMKLDLGGIAKGYAADEALRVMKEAGVPIALVDAGGDVVAGDPPPGEAEWSIGIAPLDLPDGEPDRTLGLTNRSVATSGDASQHVEIDGVRYSHIVDPRTGIGLTTRSSVTVIAADGITADALASAVSVLGAKRGVELIERIPEAETCIVTRNRDDEIETTMSSGFQRCLRPLPE